MAAISGSKNRLRHPPGRPGGSFCCKHSTQRARSTTEQHGAVQPTNRRRLMTQAALSVRAPRSSREPRDDTIISQDPEALAVAVFYMALLIIIPPAQSSDRFGWTSDSPLIGPEAATAAIRRGLCRPLKSTCALWANSRRHLSVAPVYFLTRRGIGLTPTCSSAVYGAP